MATKRRAPARRAGNRWIRYRSSEPEGRRWVIIQRFTGRVLSHHATRAKAEASFRAMESSKRRREG